jgi:hypothetical protein
MVSDLLLAIREVDEVIHLEEKNCRSRDFASGGARCHVISDPGRKDMVYRTWAPMPFRLQKVDQASVESSRNLTIWDSCIILEPKFSSMPLHNGRKILR